eukprot:1736066-Amphidinium_carterae.1
MTRVAEYEHGTAQTVLREGREFYSCVENQLVVSDKKNHKQCTPMWIENLEDIDKLTPRGSSNSS